MKERLEKLRDEFDLKEKDMALKLGVVCSVYSEWENNKLTIPTKRLYQIAEIFSVNIDYIVGLTETKKSIKINKEIEINIVSKRIRQIRKELKMTMRDLALKLNTTSSAISNYENSKFLILSPFLIELCKISNCSIDWVLGRTNNKTIE